MPCRINKRREWQYRILLELTETKSACFATLTYKELPKGGSLEPDELQKFLKRLRKDYAPIKIRYFAVGEYGDKTSRPHYHLALYGVEGCLFGQTQKKKNCCFNCSRLSKIWTKGFVHLGELNKDTAAYIGGYVTKKLTKKEDPKLNGKHPEFARMSLRPGIGASAMLRVAQAMSKMPHDFETPRQLHMGKKKFPIGRYLRGKINENLGRPKKATDKELLEQGQKMRILLEENIDKEGFQNRTLAVMWANMNAGSIASLEGKSKLRRERSL